MEVKRVHPYDLFLLINKSKRVSILGAGSVYTVDGVEYIETTDVAPTSEATEYFKNEAWK